MKGPTGESGENVRESYSVCFAAGKILILEPAFRKKRKEKGIPISIFFFHLMSVVAGPYVRHIIQISVYRFLSSLSPRSTSTSALWAGP